jgi:hypothetical protein
MMDVNVDESLVAVCHAGVKVPYFLGYNPLRI